MKTRLKCENPEKIEYTLTITASTKEFEELRDQLVSKWPSFHLSEAVTDLLSQARKIYWHQEEE